MIFSQVASAVPFDDAISSLGADNVQDAIDALASGLGGLAPLQQLYTDSSGDVAIRPGASVNSDFGLYDYLSPVLDTTPNYSLYYFEDNLTAGADSASGHAMINHNLHYARGGGAFSTTGGISLAEFSFSHEGIGNIANMHGMNLNMSVGGSGGGSVDNLNGYSLNQFIDAASLVNGGTTGYRYSLTADGNAGTYSSAYQAQFSGNYGGGIDGYYLSSSAAIVNGFRGYTLDISTTVGGQIDGYSINSSADAQSFNGFRGSSSGAISGSMNAFNFYSEGSVGDYYNALSVTLKNTITNNASMLNLYFDPAGSADSFNGINIGVSAPIAQNAFVISANVSSTIVGDLWGASLSLNGTANNKYGLQLNMQDAGNIIQGINVNLQGSAPTVSGISVNVNSITSPNRKIAAEFNGGSFTSFYEARTGNYTFNLADSINALGGTFWIDAGHPLSGGEFIFGNNIGHQIIIEDDMGPDVLGGIIGFSMNAIVGQIAAATTKTIDTINFMLTGASVPDVSGQGITDGGTITHLTCYRAIGLLPQGGNINVTNVYGLRVDSFLSAISPQNAWGFYVDDPLAENYLAKSLVVGGPSKKVTNSSTGLEIANNLGFVNGSGTTANRSALTALPGMQFFDTDLSQLFWYDGTVWVLATGAGAPSSYFKDQFAGDDATTVFVLTNTPTSNATVQLFVNGIYQSEGTHYTLSGDTITMLFVLTSIQALEAAYQY